MESCNVTTDEPYDIERATFDPKTGAIHMEVTPGSGQVVSLRHRR
jgi:hypothetical protein